MGNPQKMTLPIKYIVKSKPRTVKKLAIWIVAIGTLLLLIGNFIYTPFTTLPLELKAFAIAELLPEIIFNYNLLTILILTIGFGLLLFKWRTGKITLDNDQLKVDGSLGVSIHPKNIIDIDFFNSEFGIKRTIQINSKTDRVKLKFRNDNDFEDFSAKLIESVKSFEHINIQTWT
ncbi:MAG: hypothetical protein O9294_17990 [Cytophagales bacterium]|nr:hypothetical protein [Cytophagales bacterium]